MGKNDQIDVYDQFLSLSLAIIFKAKIHYFTIYELKQNFNEHLPSCTFCFTIILNAKVNCSSQNIQSKNEFQSTLTTANSILQSPKNSNELFYHSWLLFACILYFTFFPAKEIRLSSPLSLHLCLYRFDVCTIHRFNSSIDWSEKNDD